MTRAEKSKEIKTAFQTMLNATEAMLTPESSINSLLIVGAPGVGKTYTLSKLLNEKHSNLEYNVVHISGKMTTLALYELLYKNRFSTNILVLDDLDSIFESEDSMNLLKASLDSSKRTVSYMSSSKYLKDNGVPNSFDMQAKVIFITNKNIAKEANSSTKMSVHCKALISRSVYIDLKIHTNEDIMIHIENVMTSTNILQKYNVNQNGSDMILNWMLENQNSLRSPSLRTPVLISSMYNKFPYDWEEQCKHLFLV